ncbi:MAG: phosphatase PAP2 family protein [candidate division WOR-3 bacterium]
MIFLISLSDFQMSLLTTSYILVPYSMFNLDERIRNYSLNYKNDFLNSSFNFLNELGEGQYHIIGYSVLYFISKLKNDEKLEKFSINGLKSFLISGSTVLGLKYIFGRARPYTDEGSLSFKTFNLNNDYQSFPSGHTIIAFTTASYLSSQLNNKFISVLSYSLAIGVGMARIYKDQHWFSDVIAGAVLGIIIGGNIK